MVDFFAKIAIGVLARPAAAGPASGWISGFASTSAKATADRPPGLISCKHLFLI
jgi:hypothetical protein